MRAGTKKNLIAGLDIGTSKVVALVGDASESGGVELLGNRHRPVARPEARRGGGH